MLFIHSWSVIRELYFYQDDLGALEPSRNLLKTIKWCVRIKRTHSNMSKDIQLPGRNRFWRLGSLGTFVALALAAVPLAPGAPVGLVEEPSVQIPPLLPACSSSISAAFASGAISASPRQRTPAEKSPLLRRGLCRRPHQSQTAWRRLAASIQVGLESVILIGLAEGKEPKVFCQVGMPP